MQSFQDIIFKLKQYWADRGCIIQEPYDVEVGAGTMCPETFLRVLGPQPYRLERLVAFLQVKDSVYDVEWTKEFTYRDVRYMDELQYSVYNFEMADVATLWKLFDLHEAEAARLLKAYDPKSPEKKRFPLLPAYDQVLKCSNLFNTLDSRGAISVTERVGVIQRVRKMAVAVAAAWADQQQPPVGQVANLPADCQSAPASEARLPEATQ